MTSVAINDQHRTRPQNTALAAAVLRCHTAAGGGQGEVASQIPGVHVVRLDYPSSLMPTVYQPVLCLVAAGEKTLIWGDNKTRFGVGKSLIVSLEMPVIGQIFEASVSEPYLAFALLLDRALLRDIFLSLPDLREGDVAGSALLLSDVDDSVAQTACRLLALEADPLARQTLAPLLIRELYTWLALGQHRAALQSIALPDGRGHRVALAVAHIGQNFRRSLPAATLANLAGMGLSTFYEAFKAVTGMAPLAYQKHLRLMEARRQMLADRTTAAEAAYGVGYESPSQFSRDYARLFGLPPRRDVERLRSTIGAQ